MSSDDAGDGSVRFSRRTLLVRAAAIGAGTVVAGACASAAREGNSAAPSNEPVSAGLADPLETLTAAEAATLEAVVARLIPADENGPGAVEARASRYIDRALGGALAGSRDDYHRGLSALDAYARASRGAAFARLPPADQDAVLRDMETNLATGFTPNSLTFFNLVRTHTIQGTFGDPYYGGNAGFVGWDLIGYPGIRLAAAADDQRLDRLAAPVRRSAYDNPMFTKKRPSRASLDSSAKWPLT